jgi:uncharacterized protein (TIGR02646 family)
VFEFDRALYGDPEVREALRRAQHGKCAFCEAKITHVMYGDVEHYRPKGGFMRGGSLQRPGYYWLAYAWDNLVLACQLCNQRHKRNAFPLAGGSRRARSHRGDVAKEAPKRIRRRSSGSTSTSPTRSAAIAGEGRRSADWGSTARRSAVIASASSRSCG